MISLLSFVYLTQDISAVSESATDVHNWLDYFDYFIHPLSAHTPTGFTSVFPKQRKISGEETKEQFGKTLTWRTGDATGSFKDIMKYFLLTWQSEILQNTGVWRH